MHAAARLLHGCCTAAALLHAEAQRRSGKAFEK
jgi:hypothetical protein